MNEERAKIQQLLRESVAEINEQLLPGNELLFAGETSLLPGAGGLDSLATVNLLAAIEERLERQVGLSVSLADEIDKVGGEDPRSTIRSLGEFLSSLLSARGGCEADSTE